VSQVRVLSPRLEDVMEKKDNLPNIIALISIILFLIFVFTISRPKEIDGLQGGDIQRAIDTNQ
jgi:hypothetical protein